MLNTHTALEGLSQPFHKDLKTCVILLDTVIFYGRETLRYMRPLKDCCKLSGLQRYRNSVTYTMIGFGWAVLFAALL